MTLGETGKEERDGWAGRAGPAAGGADGEPPAGALTLGRLRDGFLGAGVSGNEPHPLAVAVLGHELRQA